MDRSTDFRFKPDQNGLFPAATETENEDMDKYWIRDNYFIYKATGEKSIPEAFKEIVNRYEEKIEEATIKHLKDDINSSSEHLHPRFDERLNEIEGEWADFQIDSTANLLEILSEEGYEPEARKVYSYLRAVEPLTTECFDLWEHNHGIHPYTLATVAKAYRSFSENVENIPEEDIELYENRIREMMPERNLSSLLVLYLEPEFIDSELKNEILRETEELTGEHGVARWEGDDWSGNDWTADTEPQWNMGHLLRYLVNDEEDRFKRQKEIKEEHGSIPESMVRYGDGVYRPNVNNPLLWAEALYTEAKERYQLEKTVSEERYNKTTGGHAVQINHTGAETEIEPAETFDAELRELPDQFKASEKAPESELDITLDTVQDRSLERISITT